MFFIIRYKTCFLMFFLFSHQCFYNYVENQVRGRSRSFKMAPFDKPYATFYWTAIVNIVLSCTICQLFDVEYYRDLEITGSALALHCCKAHAKINGKIGNSTPCKIVTHEDFNLKLGTRDYVADITHHATLGSNRPSGGFPKIGEI